MIHFFMSAKKKGSTISQFKLSSISYENLAFQLCLRYLGSYLPYDKFYKNNKKRFSSFLIFFRLIYGEDFCKIV